MNVLTRCNKFINKNNATFRNIKRDLLGRIVLRLVSVVMPFRERFLSYSEKKMSFHLAFYKLFMRHVEHGRYNHGVVNAKSNNGLGGR